MIFKNRSNFPNSKMIASYGGALLVFSLSLLLIISYTEKLVRRRHASTKKIVSSRKLHSPTISKECYQRTNGANTYHKHDYEIDYLADILDQQPTTSENIFFHVTTCSRTGLIDLNTRQACAIESAARLHPKHDVYVLFASPVGYRSRTALDLPKSIEVLKKYPNIHLRNNNLWKYAKNTPLEVWLSDGTLSETAFWLEHIADVLRYLTLYNFGGIYLDAVAQRNFDYDGQNIAGDNGDDVCGVLQFDSDQSLGEECLRLLLNHFAVQVFVDTGTIVHTKTLCDTTNGTLMTREQCKGSELCLS